MKLEALGEFVALAKYGSFSKAACELYESQSTLSSHIATLEQEIGFQLVERGNTASTLTSAGEAFLGVAQQVLHTVEDGLLECRMIANRGTPLRIAAMKPTVPFFALLRDSGFTIELVDPGIHQSIFQAIANDDLDAGFVIPPAHEEIFADQVAWEHLTMDRAAICIMDQHPLAAKEHLSRDDLRGQTIICYSGALFDDWTQTVNKMLGFDLGVDFKMHPLKNAANLAFANFGRDIYICEIKTVDEHFSDRQDVRIYDALDGQPLLFPSGIAYRVDCPKGQLAKLLDLLRENVAIV